MQKGWSKASEEIRAYRIVMPDLENEMRVTGSLHQGKVS